MSGPLSIAMNLAEAKVAFPICQDGVYVTWRCSKVSLDSRELKEPSSGVVENNHGKYLKLDFDLVDPAPDTDGQQILPGKPGSKFFDSTNLYSKNDAKDPGWFVKKIAGRIDALLGTADADNKKGKPPRPNIDLTSPTLDADLAALLVGKTLVARMRVSNSAEFGTRSEFGDIRFPADMIA